MIFYAITMPFLVALFTLDSIFNIIYLNNIVSQANLALFSFVITWLINIKQYLYLQHNSRYELWLFRKSDWDPFLTTSNHKANQNSRNFLLGLDFYERWNHVPQGWNSIYYTLLNHRFCALFFSKSKFMHDYYKYLTKNLFNYLLKTSKGFFLSILTY